MLEQYSYIYLGNIAAPQAPNEMAEFITEIGRMYNEWRRKSVSEISRP